MQFQVKLIKNFNIKNELLKIGFDPSYADCAAKKHSFLNIKIKNLLPHMATIIKEAALSAGADAGVHRDVLTHKIELSDLILSGTIKQMEQIIKSLEVQPFGLNKLAEQLKKEISLNFKKTPPLIMGILNLTPDSFSDGGKFIEEKSAIEHINNMIIQGAGIIDIGAESTRPGAAGIPFEVEIKRLKPVLSQIKNFNAEFSIDTKNAKTAEFALGYGVNIINDVSGLENDRNMIDVIRNSNCKIVIMHSRGSSQTMDLMTGYNNLLDEIFDILKNKIEFLNQNGVNSERIIIDVGFGFAKNVEQNFELLSKIQEFNSLGVKNLAGVSRKRFLKSLTDSSIEELDDITAISSFYLFENNIDIVRVHNVKKTKLALDLYNTIYLQKPYL